jgi:sporulation protein YlmC with PRC-barrel domain
MHVYDYDGKYVGRVTDVLDTSLHVRLRRHIDLRVPLEQILAVLDQQVVLTVPGGQLGAVGRR